MKASRSGSSSAEVGSSAITTSGAPISARAAATRCCWPTDSRPAGCCQWWVAKPVRSSSASAAPGPARCARRAEKRNGSRTLSSTLR